MTAQTIEELASKHCGPCEGSVERFTPKQARSQLESIPGWQLTDDGSRIRKDWYVKDFASGMAFLTGVAGLAEREGHHPDVHLINYRHVRIELSTHAIDGLSENDFVLAAKIDRLPVRLKDA